MLRGLVTIWAVALSLAACTERNPASVTDGVSGLDRGAVLDAWAGADGSTTRDMPVTSDMPGTSDMPVTRDMPVTSDITIPPDQTGGCTTNVDCPGKNQFCLLPLGCTPPGTCIKKPVNCTFIYDPVCGCDNKDYGNPCLAHAAGTSVKHQGKCGSSVTCTQIRADYSAAVAAAKKCWPMLPVVQCVTLVTQDLACGCSTAVNKNNVAEYAKIVTLEQQWAALGCSQMPWACPAMPCKSVSTGTCDPTSGQCVDLP